MRFHKDRSFLRSFRLTRKRWENPVLAKVCLSDYHGNRHWCLALVPNNTGWVRIYTAKEGEARSSHLRDSSGVFSLDEPTKNFTPWGGSLPDQQCSMRFNLNLNKGNNIYKDASTVQSPALQSLACIRIWYRPKLAKILVAVCFRCKR